MATRTRRVRPILVVGGRAVRAREFLLEVEQDVTRSVYDEGTFQAGLRQAYLSAERPGGERIDRLPVGRISEGERASGRLIYRMRALDGVNGLAVQSQ